MEYYGSSILFHVLSSSTLFHLVALDKWNLPAAPPLPQSAASRDPTGHQTACHSHPIDRWAAREHQRPATAVLADSPGDTVEEKKRVFFNGYCDRYQ